MTERYALAYCTVHTVAHLHTFTYTVTATLRSKRAAFSWSHKQKMREGSGFLLKRNSVEYHDYCSTVDCVTTTVVQ